MAHGTVGLAAVAFCVLACAAYAHAVSSSDRLVEKDITLPYARRSGLADTPVVDPPRRMAGYFKLNRTHDAHMFYFFFESRSNPSKDPVVLWMTGGPGCSSEIAILYENGPYSLNHNGTLHETEFGWDVRHNMIFVDQPVDTGFSYSQDSRDRAHDETVVAEDMLDFLQAFFQAHPEFSDNEFYVTGESYAGHYVPAVSYRLYRSNELGQFPYINLKGLAIGNGLTNPGIQFPAYAKYAYENSLISKSLYDSIDAWMPLCTWGANLCNSRNWWIACVIALDVCQMTSFERILAANPGINVYDITKTCDGPLCYDMSDADAFLNRPDVREALGVGKREWQSCNMRVNGDMMGDWLKKYDWMLRPMLEDDIRVMIYAGDLDLICNWVGNQMWVDALEWDGGEDWPSVAAEEWFVDGAAAGSARELGPLSFVRVYKAGHMVPMDQPRNALNMISRFARGKSLITEQPRQSYAQAVGRAAGAAATHTASGKQVEPQQQEQQGGRASASDMLKLVLVRNQLKDQQQQQLSQE